MRLCGLQKPTRSTSHRMRIRSRHSSHWQRWLCAEPLHVVPANAGRRQSSRRSVGRCRHGIAPGSQKAQILRDALGRAAPDRLRSWTHRRCDLYPRACHEGEGLVSADRLLELASSCQGERGGCLTRVASELWTTQPVTACACSTVRARDGSSRLCTYVDNGLDSLGWAYQDIRSGK